MSDLIKRVLLYFIPALALGTCAGGMGGLIILKIIEAGPNLDGFSFGCAFALPSAFAFALFATIERISPIWIVCGQFAGGMTGLLLGAVGHGLTFLVTGPTGQIIGGIGGIVAARIHKRSQREPLPGFCIKCGYNLRALPEPRCPECGTPFAPAQTDRAAAANISQPDDRPDAPQ